MGGAGDGVTRNNKVWHDTTRHEIWCNGGHIICEGERFYRLGHDTGPGRRAWRSNLY